MARKIKAAIAWAARVTRQLAALGALLLAVRFLWLAGGDALTYLYSRLSPAASESALEQPNQDQAPLAPNPLTDLAKKVHGTDNPHRPDLKQLDEQFQGSPAELDSRQKSPASAPIKARQLLVDIGLERSEVYIQGRMVGHTPYVGQISCAEGQQVKIEILPPEGAPTVRSAICRGETILANR